MITSPEGGNARIKVAKSKSKKEKSPIKET